MKPRSRSFGALCASLAATWLAGPALGEPPPPKDALDLTLRLPSNPHTWLRPSLRWDAAWFAGVNPWGGNARENIGDDSNAWGELGLVPAVDGQVSLGENGHLYGRLSGVFTTTQLGLDWAGSNFYDGETQSPNKMTLEDFYLGWRSGETVPALGSDAIDLSIGAQQYIVGPGDFGDGFIFYKAGRDGGRRGGFWLALRNAFQLTALARVKTGAFRGEAAFLRSDDGGGANTNLAGANFEYDFGDLLGLDLARLGLGYWNLFESDNARRDGLHVINLRLDTHPCRCLPGLRLTGEAVKEKNGSKNDSWGAWAELGYAVQNVPWKPFVSYRYVWFSGDAPGGADNGFDPLYYGFSDWSYWFIGEISGEWVAGNRNLQASILRFRAQPLASLTAQLFWIYQRVDQLQDNRSLPPGGLPDLDPRALNVTNQNFSHEIDLIFDWTVNEHLTTSFVGAVLIPLQGAEQFFGQDRTWGQLMVYWKVTF